MHLGQLDSYFKSNLLLAT